MGRNFDRALVAEKEGNQGNLHQVDTWMRCSKLLLKLDEKRRELVSNHISLDDVATELPVVSSLYPDLRNV